MTKMHMIAAPATKPPGTVESIATRRLADLRSVCAILKKSKQTPLQICRGVIKGRAPDLKTRAFFDGLPSDQKYYWISNLYTLLMPESRRGKLAAYFTPPRLAEYAIESIAASKKLSRVAAVG